MKKLIYLLFIPKLLVGQDFYFGDLFNVSDLRSAEELLYKSDYINTNFWERQTYWHFIKNEACNINGAHKLATDTGYNGEINDFIDLLKNNPEAMKIYYEIARENGYRGDLEKLKASVLGSPNLNDSNVQNCNFDCYKKDNYGDGDRCKSKSGFCEEEKTFYSAFAYNWDPSSKTASTFVTIIVNEKRDNLNCNENYKLSYSRVSISFDYVNETDYDSFKRQIQNRAKFVESIRNSGKPSTQYYEYEIDSERHLQFFIDYKEDDFYKIQLNVVYNSV